MARRLVSCHACGDDVEDPVVVNVEGESYYLCQYCFRHGRDATVRNQKNIRDTVFKSECIRLGLICAAILAVLLMGALLLW